MITKIPTEVQKWGDCKVTSLKSEGYSLVFGFTSVLSGCSIAKLRHRNNHIIYVILSSEYAELVNAHNKVIHREYFFQ